MKILTGVCTHTMDGKNRIRIPAKFKTELTKDNESLHFVQYSEGCIAVMNDSALEKRYGKFDDIEPTDEEMLNAMRCIMGKIEDAEEDTQGRSTLSKNMRDFIGADQEHNELVIVGMINYIEIWTAENYNKKIGSMTIHEAQEIIRANREKTEKVS